MPFSCQENALPLPIPTGSPYDVPSVNFQLPFMAIPYILGALVVLQEQCVWDVWDVPLDDVRAYWDTIEAQLAAYLYQAQGGDDVASYGKVVHEVAAGVAGGACLAATWNPRAFNIEDVDTANVAALSAGDVIFQPGVYRFRWWSTAFFCDLHKSALYNVSDAAFLKYGSAERVLTTAGNTSTSHGEHYLTLNAQKTLRITHYTQTAKTVNGLGLPVSVGAELYGMLEWWHTPLP